MTSDSDLIAGSALERATEAIVGIGYRLLISAEQTGGAYELIQFVVPAGHGPPLHRHQHEDEMFYVTVGELEITYGGAAQRGGPGTYVHLTRGIPHTFKNIGRETATFLCWVVPGNLGGFFDAFKRPWPAGEIHPPAVTEEDIGKLLEAARRYDIEILG